MKNKLFVIVGPFGSGVFYKAEKIKARRKRECTTFDKVYSIDFLKERIESELRKDRDVYILSTRIENIPKNVLDIADKIIIRR